MEIEILSEKALILGDQCSLQGLRGLHRDLGTQHGLGAQTGLHGLEQVPDGERALIRKGLDAEQVAVRQGLGDQRGLRGQHGLPGLHHDLGAQHGLGAQRGLRGLEHRPLAQIELLSERALTQGELQSESASAPSAACAACTTTSELSTASELSASSVPATRARMQF
jgi:hypothetical protein